MPIRLCLFKHSYGIYGLFNGQIIVDILLLTKGNYMAAINGLYGLNGYHSRTDSFKRLRAINYILL